MIYRLAADDIHGFAVIVFQKQSFRNTRVPTNSFSARKMFLNSSLFILQSSFFTKPKKTPEGVFFVVRDHCLLSRYAFAEVANFMMALYRGAAAVAEPRFA